MRKVTIQEIAKEMGLSRNTVSKALAGSRSVSESTRYAILKKACAMGYTKLRIAAPDEFFAKSEPSTNHTVIVYARREISDFWNQIIMGISDELNARNIRLSLQFASVEDERTGTLAAKPGDDVAGIIVLNVFSAAFTKSLADTGLPIIFLDSPRYTDECLAYGDVILTDGQNSVRAITNHLISQGLSRLAFIGDTTYCRSIADRYTGFYEALSSHQIALDSRIIFTSHVPERYYCEKEVEEAIHAMPYIPDGIVCANDDIAMFAVSVLSKHDISVPKDVVVTGFDNKMDAAVFEPALTTVDIRSTLIGHRLVQKLIWRLEHPNMPREEVYVGTQVIYRESSDKVKNVF